MVGVVAVFGGTKGIGQGIARKFLQNGIKVAILSRNQERIKKARQQLLDEDVMKESENHLLGVACDVNDENTIHESLKITEQKLGPITAVINSAGINEDALLVKASSATIQNLISTNLIGTILTSKAAIKYMLPRKNGCIINIGSIIGVKGNSGQSIYSASKSGLIGFTKSLAKEVAGRGIRVNLLLPGFIETDMTLNLKSHQMMEELTILKRRGKLEDIANAADLFYNSTYITGMVMYIDGGLHLNI